MIVDTAVVVDKVVGYARRIAVVGLSGDPSKASFGVGSYLLLCGYEIIPVNPTIDEALGLRSYPSLADVPGHIDIVDVFRRPEYLAGVARETAEIGARCLWLQLGLSSPEACSIAEEAHLDYVEDACLKVEVAHRTGQMVLPPEPARL